MPAKEVVHFRTDRKFTKCGLNLTWSRDPRFRGNNPRGLTNDKKKVTCKNCIAVLNAPSKKVHYVPYRDGPRGNHRTLCGFVWHPFRFTSDILFSDQARFGPITCKNCKRILRAQSGKALRSVKYKISRG